MKKFNRLFAFAFLFILLSSHTLEEGMFPLSEISKLELQKAGLRIKTEEIFNPDGTSLVDALVRVGGCTGSFVSDEGLIVTNHHCAFGAIAAATTPENNYLTKGFYATGKETEIRTSITARITASYEDVSARVLAGTENMDPAAKVVLIQQNIKRIETEEKALHPSLLPEISEMFQGRSYTLFRYRELKDIRLVYVPPRSVGEFGGESDNWVWPRHNGDFSFMRAYVAPDGAAAAYAPENIPYKPKKFLKINPKGVKENDFVFILGYPGRTFRNQPSQFLAYQNEYVLPYITEWYDFQIDAIKQISKKSKEKEISLASEMKSLANVTKNYKGKLQGLKRTSILEDRKKEDAAMQQMIAADPKMAARYGTLFADIDAVYKEKLSTGYRDLWLGQAFNSSAVFYAAYFIAYHNEQANAAGKEGKKDYIANTLPKQIPVFKRGYSVADMELEKILLKKLLIDGYHLPEGQKLQALEFFGKKGNAEKNINDYVDQLFSKSKLADYNYMTTTADKEPGKLLKINDPLVSLAADLYKVMQEYQAKEKARQDQLTDLLPKLLEVKLLYKKSDFIPDANSTLRFTYGRVKGYFPADADYHHPFTSLKGILQKAEASGDYFMEEEIQQLLATSDLSTIVCFLYNLDTTGGNSGSPIMDADGNLVGVNFDRAYTATINDYAWNEEYSRSIGVDVRYMIYILKNLAKANALLTEMGVQG